TTYYYKVLAYGFNDANQENVESGLSQINIGTLQKGWDTAPDITEPTTPSEVKVKDIHSNTDMVRNIITWAMIADSQRNGASDFARYEIWRYETNLGIGTAANIATKTDRGDNYHVDGISVSAKDIDYSYYVVAVDNANTAFKYANDSIINSSDGTVANAYSPNMSGHLTPVPINPGAAIPTITSSYNISGVNYKARVIEAERGVSSASIEWTTDQDTDSLVEYRKAGTSDKFLGTYDGQLIKNHKVTLKALEPNVSYEYKVVSRNYPLKNITEAGYGASNTSVQSLKTKNFTISHNSSSDVTATTTTTTVKWNTGEVSSDSLVEYQLQTPAGPSGTSKVAGSGAGAGENQELTTGHSVDITGLKPNSRYSYVIRSTDKDKFTVYSGLNYFQTKSYDASQFTITPNASSIAEQNITATSAKIVWNTAVATTSWLDYGTSAGVYNQSAGDNRFNTVHVVELLNLTPGNTYYYKVRGKDSNDIEYTSQEYSFTAVLLPEISNAKVADLGHYSATIAFDTNVDASSFVAYGKEAGYGSGVGKNDFSRNHSTKIDDLEDNTTYHYQVAVKDKLGNEIKSDDLTFSTPIDTTGPEVKEVKIDILPMGTDDETASAIISWTTNKPATTQIEYDEGVIGGKYSKHSIEDASLNTAHTVIVKDLNPSATYHFHIVSKDKRENKTNSQDYTFVTPTKEKSVLQLIIRSLEETFSWVSQMPRYFKGLGQRITGR
ncbi:hypothetical protein COY62_02700, partial [bacterium (Candidatus Howlettbacteria) CG_4_10_14_0_8_um_filter_40_9]